MEAGGLPIHEIIIPILSWTLIIIQYLLLIHEGAFRNAFQTLSLSEQEVREEGEGREERMKRFFPYHFFSTARIGWVQQSHLTGQAAANTTRDYLRAIIFYAGNAAVLGALVVGYTVTGYDRNGNSYDKLRTFQMGFLSFLLFVIFFLFLHSTRFAVHFHFLMNVKYIDDNVPLTLPIIEKVFERSYSYYTAGVRLYLVLIPMFAWLVSSWLLLAITLPHMYLVYDYDNMSWLEGEVRELYAKYDHRYQPLAVAEEKGDERVIVDQKGKILEVEIEILESKSQELLPPTALNGNEKV